MKLGVSKEIYRDRAGSRRFCALLTWINTKVFQKLHEPGLGGTAEPDRPHSLLNLSLRVCVPVRACAVYHTALRHLNAHAHQALLAVLSWSALEVSPVESLRVLPFLLCLVWFAH